MSRAGSTEKRGRFAAIFSLFIILILEARLLGLLEEVVELLDVEEIFFFFGSAVQGDAGQERVAGVFDIQLVVLEAVPHAALPGEHGVGFRGVVVGPVEAVLRPLEQMRSACHVVNGQVVYRHQKVSAVQLGIILLIRAVVVAQALFFRIKKRFQKAGDAVAGALLQLFQRKAQRLLHGGIVRVRTGQSPAGGENQGEERNFHLADKWPEAGSFS